MDGKWIISTIMGTFLYLNSKLKRVCFNFFSKQEGKGRKEPLI